MLHCNSRINLQADMPCLALKIRLLERGVYHHDVRPNKKLQLDQNQGLEICTCLQRSRRWKASHFDLIP